MCAAQIPCATNNAEIAFVEGQFMFVQFPSVVPVSLRRPCSWLWLLGVICLAGCGSNSAKPYRIEVGYAVGDAQFVRTMGNLLGPPIIPGNRIQTLLNGDEIFPAMLDAIRAAKQTITLETY